VHKCGENKQQGGNLCESTIAQFRSHTIPSKALIIKIRDLIENDIRRGEKRKNKFE